MSTDMPVGLTKSTPRTQHLSFNGGNYSRPMACMCGNLTLGDDGMGSAKHKARSTDGLGADTWSKAMLRVRVAASRSMRECSVQTSGRGARSVRRVMAAAGRAVCFEHDSGRSTSTRLQLLKIDAASSGLGSRADSRRRPEAAGEGGVPGSRLSQARPRGRRQRGEWRIISDTSNDGSSVTQQVTDHQWHNK